MALRPIKPRVVPLARSFAKKKDSEKRSALANKVETCCSFVYKTTSAKGKEASGGAESKKKGDGVDLNIDIEGEDNERLFLTSTRRNIPAQP